MREVISSDLHHALGKFENPAINCIKAYFLRGNLKQKEFYMLSKVMSIFSLLSLFLILWHFSEQKEWQERG